MKVWEESYDTDETEEEESPSLGKCCQLTEQQFLALCMP